MNNNNLIEDNMELAYNLAWKYYQKFNKKIDIEDLKSIALLGLVKAAKQYNVNLNIKFSTYAYTVIKNLLINELTRGNKYTDVQFLDIVELNNVSTEDTLEDKAQLSIRLEFLKQCCKELTEEDKQILYLKSKGYTFSEIANKMNRALITIQKKYDIVLRKLRIKFAQKEQGLDWE